MSRIGIVVVALASLLIFPHSMPAQSVTEGASTYIEPVRSTPTGLAPRMKVQLLDDQNGRKEYAVIFSTGDEAFSGLTDFAKQYHISSAHFTAIGAVSGATVGWFDPSRKLYKAMPFTGQMEVLSMIGDIALYNGKPTVHTHVVLGLPDGSTRGGHLIELHVRPTLEVMVTVDPKDMQKRLDPETHLTLIDPSPTQP